MERQCQPMLFVFLVWRKFSERDYNKANKKKNCYVALSRPTVKCEKTGSVFFFFFCCWKCQIWAKNLLKFVFNGLKKHLYMRFDCIPPKFSPFRNFKKILENSTLSRYVKKKNKKKSTDRPNFQILVGWGQHNNFFFWPKFVMKWKDEFIHRMNSLDLFMLWQNYSTCLEWISGHLLPVRHWTKSVT